MEEDYTSETRPASDLVSAVYEIIESLVFAIVSVIVLFTFVARLSVVDGSSMYPTLSDKDYLVVSDLFYTYSPDNGDVVVIHTDDYEKPLVKRVIATEGQEIKIRYYEGDESIEDDIYEVYVDGVLLDEKYASYFLYKNPYTGEYYTSLPDVAYSIRKLHYKIPSNDDMSFSNEGGFYTFTTTVPEDSLFVMGDNRNDSLDSRYDSIGFIKEEFVLGKVVFRLLPFEKIGVIK